MSTPAETRLRDGDLDGALAALSDAVRAAPGDARLRVFLFQLLCLRGEWTRAVAQLRTAATLDPAAEEMARMYRAAIVCEIAREKVFAGAASPTFFGEPAPWMAWMAEALRLDAAGETAAADALRARAFDAAPATPGALDGRPFAWIADADPRLGPLLEIVVNGRYFWAPFAAVSRLTVEAPADLRDRVWTPAHVTWANGGEAVALIPTRYPAPRTPAQALARETAWAMDGDRVAAGLGQRLLVTDAGECGLMDLRALVLTPETDAETDAETAPAPGAAHG